jgi:hypothetical protein
MSATATPTEAPGVPAADGVLLRVDEPDLLVAEHADANVGDNHLGDPRHADRLRRHPADASSPRKASVERHELPPRDAKRLTPSRS